MIVLDGAAGEGGGQILRSALTLALATGRPFRINRIRAGRERPGLLRQHLTAVQAAAAVCGAEVKGAELGSRRLEFQPGSVCAGEYRCEIGSAGSTTLVAQTLVPALIGAAGPSIVIVEGGTHNRQSPPFEFFERTYLGLLRRMGAGVRAVLERHGFHPRGEGRLRLEVQGGQTLRPLFLTERGAIVRRTATAVSARLPEHIAQRELRHLEKELGWKPEELAVEQVTDAASPGNLLLAELETEQLIQVIASFGEKGVPAEVVARQCALQIRRYEGSAAAVDEYLADQLLIPAALAGAGEYTATAVSSHFITNVEVVKAFLDVEAATEQHAADLWRVKLRREC